MPRISMAERLKKSGTATVARLDEARNRIKEQSAEQTEDQSSGHSGGHSGGRTDTLADTLTDTLADTITDSQENTLGNSPRNTLKHTHKCTLTDSPANNPYFWMTPNQAAVLAFLSTIPSGKTRLADICNGTNVPYGTVRKSLVALERNNCITKPKKVRIGQWQGMHVELLESGKKWKTLQNTLRDSPAGGPKNTLKDGHSGGHSGGQTLYSSSSSLLNKTTTIQNCETDPEIIISEIMASDSEYAYWTDQQVGPIQVNAWKAEFGLNLQTILNNLCYVRWQILHQKTKIKKSAADLIYGIMKKTGGTVNKPAGYKTMAQQDLAFYEGWKKQRVEHAQQIEKIKRETIEAEIAPKIAAILKKPELENKFIQAALESIHSKSRKQVISNMIKSGEKLDAKSDSVLKGYLKKILTDEALERLSGNK